MKTDVPPQPETLYVGDDSLVIQVNSEMSHGKVVASEVTIPAGGGPPMLHRHAAEELYRVLGGELSFYVADDQGRITTNVKRTGEVAYIPGGVEHTIRNESNEPATAFVVFSGDAAPMEAFARSAAALADEGPPQVTAVIAAATRHGIEMTRPL